MWATFLPWTQQGAYGHDAGGHKGGSGAWRLSGGGSSCIGAVCSAVASLLPVVDVVVLGCTSRWWAGLVRDKQLWAELLLRDFGKEDSGDPRQTYVSLDFQLERLASTTKVDATLRFIIVGDAGTGKTSFLHRFNEGTFRSRLHSTIDAEVKSVVVQHEGFAVRLELWDVVGDPECFRPVHACYYRWANGVLLMYDEWCRRSFDSARTEWYADVRQHGTRQPGVLLCALKGDRHTLQVLRHGQAQVSPEEGAMAAKELGVAFARTSAWSSWGVDWAVALLLQHCRAAVQRQRLERVEAEARAAAICAAMRLADGPLGRAGACFGHKYRWACSCRLM